jgi:hypothetical protein
MKLAAGRYKMRNGHTAEVAKPLIIPCADSKYTFWLGKCVECNAACTWNADGTYGFRRHEWDIVSAIK